MNVHIVTDSTADLPPDLARSMGITVVPLVVNFGDQSFRDGVDISADEFYPRLLSSEVLPKTSQPSVGDFLEVYKNLGKGKGDILSLHISSKLSGTYNSAINAAANMDGRRIEVVDTETGSAALGLITLAAAREAQKGATLDEITKKARDVASKIHLFFCLDTLEYLQKGGRIGKAQALLGSLLQLKPILTVRDGEVHPLDRARTRPKAINRVFEMIANLGVIEEAAVYYTTGRDEAQAIADRLRPMCKDNSDILMGYIGPVVGTHAGPGCIGIALRTE